MAHTVPTPEALRLAAEAFAFAGSIQSISICGNGHVNQTFVVETTERRYILQHLNTSVFKRPHEVMANIEAVTEHLRRCLIAAGEDAERGTMRVIYTHNGAHGYTDSEGRFWRAYDFVENTICRLLVDSPETFARVGEAFGDFQRRLSDFPAETLYESIPLFHDTTNRYANFLASLQADPMDRAKDIEPEIRAIQGRADRVSLIVDALASGEIPLRVTHNDTKLSNLLLDAETEKSVCIIDLDTVMPGSALYDFGDSIRAGASSADEDEQDLSKVHFLPAMFEAYAYGFLKGTAGALTPRELELLPDGAYLMTLECAIRFLGDYLDGDIYFHTTYPTHNLIRARTQLKLLEEMDACMPALRAFVATLH